MQRRLPVVLSLAVLMVMLASMEVPGAAKKKDPPGTETNLAILRAWFARYSNDKNEIGKVEAAKAFGYSKPYDVPAGPVLKTPTGKPKDDDKDSSETAPKSDKPDKSTYANRPDFLFIAALDTDGDGKVSKEEFDTWAHDYAVQLALSEQGTSGKQTKAQQAAAKNFQQQQKQFGNQITSGGKSKK
jgi:hypothetical protein